MEYDDGNDDEEAIETHIYSFRLPIIPRLVCISVMAIRLDDAVSVSFNLRIWRAAIGISFQTI